MSKTAKMATAPKQPRMASEAEELVFKSWNPIALSAIFNTMRILKRINPGDTYYEAYLGMKEKYGRDFYDTYQLLWSIGAHRAPKRILEIGCRTGISICQLLSAHSKMAEIEKIVLVDPFDQWTSANLVRANLKYLNLPSEKPEILAIKSQDYFSMPLKPCQFDYILVDGDHNKSVAAQDLIGAHEILEPGGIIVMDDISTAPGECALIDVWEGWKAQHETEYTFFNTMEGKGMGLAIKNKE